MTKHSIHTESRQNTHIPLSGRAESRDPYNHIQARARYTPRYPLSLACLLRWPLSSKQNHSLDLLETTHLIFLIVLLSGQALPKTVP